MEYKEYKKEVLETLEGKRKVILSDDYDGYISASIAKKTMDTKIVGYFSPVVYAVSGEQPIKDIVGLDITLDRYTTSIPCISNHVESVTMGDKLSSGVSCNKHIDTRNYTEKSLFSTSLLLWGSMNLPLPKTEEGRMILLALDSSYKQYYNVRFKKHTIGYFKAYGIEELLETLERHTEREFDLMITEYGLHHDIKLIEGVDGLRVDEDTPFFNNLTRVMELLELPLLDLPKFDRGVNLERHFVNTYDYYDFRRDNEVFSYAIPYKKTVSCSVIKNSFKF